MAYEEARKLRLEENHKRFQDLGISQISKALTQISKKTPQQRIHRPSHKPVFAPAEPRRSSRARTLISSYSDYVDVDIDHKLTLRKSRHKSSWASYIARPLHGKQLRSHKEIIRKITKEEESIKEPRRI